MYFLDDPETLKQEYIKHLNCLTVNMDVNNIDFKSQEYLELEAENQSLKEDNERINLMWDEIQDLKKRQELWDNIKGD